METYVCILLAADGRIVTVESFTVSSESDACDRAARLARSRDGTTRFELWNRGRKLLGSAVPDHIKN